MRPSAVPRERSSGYRLSPLDLRLLDGCFRCQDGDHGACHGCSCPCQDPPWEHLGETYDEKRTRVAHMAKDQRGRWPAMTMALIFRRVVRQQLARCKVSAGEHAGPAELNRLMGWADDHQLPGGSYVRIRRQELEKAGFIKVRGRYVATCQFPIAREPFSLQPRGDLVICGRPVSGHPVREGGRFFNHSFARLRRLAPCDACRNETTPMGCLWCDGTGYRWYA